MCQLAHTLHDIRLPTIDEIIYSHAGQMHFDPFTFKDKSKFGGIIPNAYALRGVLENTLLKVRAAREVPECLEHCRVRRMRANGKEEDTDFFR